jgi:RNA polymerase sigma-70 factor (ECF subfamily)
MLAVAFVASPAPAAPLGVVVPAGWGYEKGAVVATLDAEAQTAADVMGRYCAGDAAAFHKLYGLLAPRILAYLRGLLMGDQAAAEDMLQLTFLKVHEARDTYVRGANPIPWIYTIAHRTTLDELRKRKRSRVRLTKDGEVGGAAEPAAAISGAAADAESDVDREAIAGALAALEHLPENQREALLLTKVHGRTHAEAAQITGTTPGAIKLRAHRAYVTLRQLLARKPAAPAAPPQTKATGAAAKAAEKELG